MNYSEILAQLNAASAFDLYRLRAAIDRTLDEAAWMFAVQARLCVGQIVLGRSGPSRYCQRETTADPMKTLRV